jgi:hypothetical protein
MKTQHEATIQFSGYPLRIVETDQKSKQFTLRAVKSSTDWPLSSQKNYIANDPKNWDIDWFNSYE